VGRITTPWGITLEYETYGSPADAPLLLVAGFGSQLIAWPAGFCERLADGGLHVICFDNRDCGLSSKLDGQQVEPTAISAAVRAGELDRARALAPYTLSDMSDDALALLSALGIERAHVLGASMGAMIAQTMAIEHPERLLTLTSMMSNTGEPDYGQSTPEAAAALLAAPAADRDGYIAAAENSLVWRSKRYPELERLRATAAAAYDRCHYPEGNSRQLAAMLAGGPRDAGLRALDLPTLVIHGLDDTLIAPSGGERTASLVPGARLMMIADMGHDRPEPLWPEICNGVLEHTTAHTIA
jgi:pimeloyl-ACP methyl ester carboxylesterase